MVHWAQFIGPHTARLLERIMNDKPHPEMGYLLRLGIIRLAGQYSPARMEAAEPAVATGARRYQKREIDSVELARRGTARGASSNLTPPPPHDNIRGA